jgi:hypothetical protein
VAELNLHTLDKRVSGLEDWKDTMPETMDLKIENEINRAVIKLVGWVAGLLFVQSLAERFLGI